MPGVLQVEALAQTMAVYVAKQPGFGDRIGLFAGIDDCRFKRVVSPGDTLRLEVTMDKLGGRFGRGRGRRQRRRRDRLRGHAQLHHPRRKASFDDAGGHPLGRPRQRGRPRGRAQGASRREAGPRGDRRRPRAQRPGSGRRASTSCGRWRRTARVIVSGNTDIAVADFDYAAAFPWMADGVPDTFRAAAEWAHDALGDERVAWLRRLPGRASAAGRRRHDGRSSATPRRARRPAASTRRSIRA